jgi:polyphosphate kinase
LEHSRIFYFENACQPEIYVGSADWMPRNFFWRIEVVFPIEDGNLRERISSELLPVSLADNVKARMLQADGNYRCPPLGPGDQPRRSQAEFIALALNSAAPPASTLFPRGRFPRVKLQPRPVPK